MVTSLDALPLPVNSRNCLGSFSSWRRSTCQEEWWSYLAKHHSPRPGEKRCNLSGSRAAFVRFVQARPTYCPPVSWLAECGRQHAGLAQTFYWIETYSICQVYTFFRLDRPLCDQAKSSSIRCTIKLTPSSRPSSFVIQIRSQIGEKISELTFSFSWKAGSSRA